MHQWSMLLNNSANLDLGLSNLSWIEISPLVWVFDLECMYYTSIVKNKNMLENDAHERAEKFILNQNLLSKYLDM